MSDLLGSILNSMQKPPTVSSERNKLLQKQKKILEKHQAAQKEKLKRFREKIEKEINEFVQDASKQKHKFEIMDKVLRNIIHDVAEIAGLSAYAFGEEEVDRYCMIFKKEFAPSEDELAAYRNREEWDPIKAKEMNLLKVKGCSYNNIQDSNLCEGWWMEKQKEEEVLENKKRKHEIEPANNYAMKYEKLVGLSAGKDAAQKTTPNKQFGFVPSEQKKDQRSIEQTLADIQAKKKQKKSDEAKTAAAAEKDVT